MKCFECDAKCVTWYWHNDRVLGRIDFNAGTKVTHINSACLVCGWTSHKLKLPEAI